MVTTAAHALHKILTDVRRTQNGSVLGGWTEVLGCKQADVEWGQRHGEVVRLHQRVLEQLLSLPEGEATRETGLRYAPAWYSAIVWPSHWQSNQEPAVRIISDADLDMLGVTADFLALRLAGTAAVPHRADLDRLRSEISEWIDLIGETTDLAEAIKVEVAGQLRHVLWLIDNIETYGTASVVREAQTAVGKVSETVFTRMGQSPWKKKWVRHYGSLLVALGLLSQGLDATNLVLDKAKDTLSVVAEVAQEADDLLDTFRGPKAIESGQRPELEAGPSDAVDQGDVDER